MRNPPELLLANALRGLAREVHQLVQQNKTDLAWRKSQAKSRNNNGLRFTYAVGPFQKKGAKMPLTVKLTTEQQVTVTITPGTAKEKPAKLDGVPSWSVSVGDAMLIPADDGLSCVIVSPDLPGSSQVLVTADADLGAGVETISDTIDVQVGSANATSLGLKADAPVTKP